MVITLDLETGDVNRTTPPKTDDSSDDYDEAILYSEWNPALAEVVREATTPRAGLPLDAETLARFLDDIE